MAKALVKRGVIRDATAGLAEDTTLGKMGAALSSPKEFVGVQLGGQ